MGFYITRTNIFYVTGRAGLNLRVTGNWLELGIYVRLISLQGGLRWTSGGCKQDSRMLIACYGHKFSSKKKPIDASCISDVLGGTVGEDVWIREGNVTELFRMLCSKAFSDVYVGILKAEM